MQYGINGYVYGKVLHKKYLGDNNYKYKVFTEDTKEVISVVMTSWDIGTGDEIELLSSYKHTIIARHNITKNIKEKINDEIQFPTEVFENNILNQHEIRKQKLHMLYQNVQWLQGLYKKYNYLIEHGGNIWGARDPNCEKTFTSPKQYFDNARHINFFYNIVKGREEIRDVFDERLLNGGVFDSIVKNYYMEFLLDIKNIPDTYPTIEEFSKHFADIRYEVGL